MLLIQILLSKPTRSLCVNHDLPFNSSATEFISKLNTLHKDIAQPTAHAQDTLSGNVALGVKVDMARLRASMDLCLEQLPFLLKIEGGGAVSVTQLLPRVLSQLRALSVYSDSSITIGFDDHLSESMSYVLQKVSSLTVIYTNENIMMAITKSS